jgi:hypothetical protein
MIISDEYKEFLIDAFSHAKEYLFDMERVRKLIYSNEKQDRFYYGWFKTGAQVMVNNQKVELPLNDSIKYENHYCNCGILISRKYIIEDLYLIGIYASIYGILLIKTQEQLDNIFDAIENNTESYIQVFYAENITEIKRRRELLIKKVQDKKDRREIKEMKEKILESERKKQLKKIALGELIEEGLIFNVNGRESIPEEIMNQVWNRDGGACAKCGSKEDLEFDHIIPVSKGGATTYRNLQILCQKCNREKSDKI